jgi:hypothetical protein
VRLFGTTLISRARTVDLHTRPLLPITTGIELGWAQNWAQCLLSKEASELSAECTTVNADASWTPLTYFFSFFSVQTFNASRGSRIIAHRALGRQGAAFLYDSGVVSDFLPWSAFLQVQRRRHEWTIVLRKNLRVRRY